MKKPIKFSLSMNGRYINNMKEFRINFDNSIILMHRSGFLKKWLANQGFETYNKALDEIPLTNSDDDLIDSLAMVFEIDRSQALKIKLKIFENKMSLLHAQSQIKSHQFEESLREINDQQKRLSELRHQSNEKLQEAVQIISSYKK